MKRNAIRSAVTLLAVMLFGIVHAGTVTYVYTDPQGTPLAEADASGNITARFEYTPYGVPVASMGAAPDGVGYTGHVNDPKTGLIYMQARYYDAEVGRFLSVDPVGPSPGNGFNFNRYTYVNNNPVMHVDPTGMACGGNGEVSDAVQRMRDTSDNCGGTSVQPSEGTSTSRSTSAGVVSISVSAAVLPKGAEGIVGSSVLRASPWLAALALSGDTAHNGDEAYIYATYTRLQPNTGLVYSGRTSGWINLRSPGDPQRLVTLRSYGQPHLNSEGFLSGVIDAWSTDYGAIRGREQQLIDFHGGARSEGGASRNMINGISPYNIFRNYYMNRSNAEFGGPLPNNAQLP